MWHEEEERNVAQGGHYVNERYITKKGSINVPIAIKPNPNVGERMLHLLHQKW